MTRTFVAPEGILGGRLFRTNDLQANPAQTTALTKQPPILIPGPPTSQRSPCMLFRWLNCVACLCFFAGSTVWRVSLSSRWRLRHEHVNARPREQAASKSIVRGGALFGDRLCADLAKSLGEGRFGPERLQTASQVEAVVHLRRHCFKPGPPACNALLGHAAKFSSKHYCDRLSSKRYCDCARG